MDQSVRKQKSGDQLAPGDWLAPEELVEGAAEVLFVLTYPASADRSRDNDGKHVQLVVRELGSAVPFTDVVAGTTLFALASDEDLAEYREAGLRTQKIADIRAYVAWLEANPGEPVGYGFGGQVDVHGDDAEAVAKVRAFAALYGARVRDDLDDRTTARLSFGSVEHVVIAWHREGRPVEPTPEPADPTGLSYSRADEADDPTPVSGGRVEPHTGGMTDGGLVDETPLVCVCDVDPLTCGGHGPSARASLAVSNRARGLVDETASEAR